eukprot:COSAG01_NODE_1209_length_11232_cov_5.378818_1_plen_361_part_00
MLSPRTMLRPAQGMTMLFCPRSHSWLQIFGVEEGHNIARLGFTERALSDIGQVRDISEPLVTVGAPQLQPPGTALLRIGWSGYTTTAADELYHASWGNVSGEAVLSTPLPAALAGVNTPVLDRAARIGALPTPHTWLVELILPKAGNIHNLVDAAGYQLALRDAGQGLFGDNELEEEEEEDAAASLASLEHDVQRAAIQGNGFSDGARGLAMAALGSGQRPGCGQPLRRSFSTAAAGAEASPLRRQQQQQQQRRQRHRSRRRRPTRGSNSSGRAAATAESWSPERHGVGPSLAPYVPTPAAGVNAALRLARLRPDDVGGTRPPPPRTILRLPRPALAHLLRALLPFPLPAALAGLGLRKA